MKSISFKCSDEMDAQLNAEAEKQKATVSDLIRKAVEAYFMGNEQRQRNMKTLHYEIVKAQFLIARVGDPEKTILTKELCEQAGLDAEAYLKNGSTR